MMFKIIFCALITSVLCHDVYHFEINRKKEITEWQYCDKAQEYRCSSLETCCPTGLANPYKFQCCGIAKANCCNNGKACCPESYICSSNADKCYPNLLSIFLEKSFDSHKTKKNSYNLRLKTKLSNIICPDGTSQCDDSQTCCQLEDGSYGCCPGRKAVCCNDHLHCCPQDTTCDLSAGTCDSGNKQIVSLLKKLPAKKVKSVICPDGTSQCGDGQTCCQLGDGSYGCCPDPDAVCCKDHLHCCPQGTTCNLSAGTCDSGNKRIVLLLSKLPAKKAFFIN